MGRRARCKDDEGGRLGESRRESLPGRELHEVAHTAALL